MKQNHLRDMNYKTTNIMRKLPFLFVIAILAITVIGCKNNKSKQVLVQNTSNSDSLNAGDSTIYGVMLDGGMNSILLLTDAGDTIEFLENPDDTLEVVKGGKLVGDRFAVIGYKQYGDLILRSAVNLTSLLGSWNSLDKDFELKEGGAIVSKIESERNPWSSWKMYNGQLVLSKDTFDILQLGADTLSLENKDGIFIFTRKK